MQIIQYPAFERFVKKIHPNAKRDLDKTIKLLSQNPLAGDLKKGDLNMVRVYKFKMVNHPMLLAYLYDESEKALTLLALGPHENFYRDLKKSYLI